MSKLYTEKLPLAANSTIAIVFAHQVARHRGDCLGKVGAAIAAIALLWFSRDSRTGWAAPRSDEVLRQIDVAVLSISAHFTHDIPGAEDGARWQGWTPTVKPLRRVALVAGRSNRLLRPLRWQLLCGRPVPTGSDGIQRTETIVSDAPSSPSAVFSRVPPAS